jgi:multiple sugar transport system permease protein
MTSLVDNSKGRLAVGDTISRERRLAYLLLIPCVFVLVAVTIYPFIYAIFLALRNQEGVFVGAQNFISIFTDLNFLNSARVTLIYSVVTVLAELVLGMGVALLLSNKLTVLPNFWQFILLVPMMVAPVIAGLTWRIMFHPTLGIIKWALNAFGLGSPEWLTNPSVVLFSVAMIDVWQWTPFIFIIFHAGLQTVDPSIYEAATLDGASKIRVFKDMTLVFLRPIIAIAAFMRLLDTFRIFDPIMGCTRGGPGVATETLSIYVYKIAFKFSDYNYAAAVSFFMLVIALVISTFLLRYALKRAEMQLK